MWLVHYTAGKREANRREDAGKGAQREGAAPGAGGRGAVTPQAGWARGSGFRDSERGWVCSVCDLASWGGEPSRLGEEGGESSKLPSEEGGLRQLPSPCM